MQNLKLIGPFRQLLTMDDLPARGPLSDIQLEIVEQAGILINDDIIETVAPYRELLHLASSTENIQGELTALPGMIDVHTHICWAGSRANDYAMRLAGNEYVKIAEKGGGIWSTVTKTREASKEVLRDQTVSHAAKLLHQGITTIEVKSGYGLTTDAEMKMLAAIHEANEESQADLIPTCLAAHIKPKDFKLSEKQYLESIIHELLPAVKSQQLSSRVDIYIDNGAFSAAHGRYFLSSAKNLGFDLIVHADQFMRGGLLVAMEMDALSADHLEISSDKDFRMLGQSNVIPVVLPASSLGLGTGFAHARKILNSGSALVIASDWNPGSAPMGNLLVAASVIGVYEKLNMAETLAAVTCRAAPALRLNDRGILKPGMVADFIAFPCANYKEILYNQGSMQPVMVWKSGELVTRDE